MSDVYATAALRLTKPAKSTVPARDALDLTPAWQDKDDLDLTLEDIAEMRRAATSVQVTGPCPECHGLGYVIDSHSGQFGDTHWVSNINRPCPNGCPQPVPRNRDRETY